MDKYLRLFNIERALNYITILVKESNKYIEENKPWELAKTDSYKFAEVMKRLNLNLHVFSQLLIPFLTRNFGKNQESFGNQKNRNLVPKNKIN